jgi:hypothetical protein
LSVASRNVVDRWKTSTRGAEEEGVIAMIIDCQSCPVRDLHCDDCMVTALLTPTTSELPLDAAERAAVTGFAAAGLVSAREAGSVTARREPWAAHARAVG